MATRDDDDDRPRRSRRDDDDENRPRRARRDEDDEDRPRRSRKDEELDEDRPRRSRQDLEDEDEDRPRRRSRAADDDEDRSIRKKRRKKQRAFSITEAIPLDFGMQIGIGAVAGLACFIGARLGQIDVLYLPGLFFCLWGCAALAKNNGRSEMFGLLGLFGPIGFVFTGVLAKPKE